MDKNGLKDYLEKNTGKLLGFLIMTALVIFLFVAVLLFIVIIRNNNNTQAQKQEQPTVVESQNTSQTDVILQNNENINYTAVCPACNNTLLVTEQMLKTGKMFCPNCGQELLFSNDAEQTITEIPQNLPQTEEIINDYHTEMIVSQPAVVTDDFTSPPATEPPTRPTDPPQTTAATRVTVPPATTNPPATAPPPMTEAYDPVDLIPSFSTASSSSVLKPVYSGNKKYTYEAFKTLDDDHSTCWCEGAKDSGVGEYITLHAERKQRLDEIIIYNGLCTDEELFYKNCRIKECKIEFSDGTSTNAILSGEYSEQPSKVKLTDTVDTEYIKITILSTYSGNKYSDTCVSEIKVKNNS